VSRVFESQQDHELPGRDGIINLSDLLEEEDFSDMPELVERID